MNLIEWYSKLGWKQNPFTFEVIPDILVGYKEQIDKIQTAILSKQKVLLVIGPTGSGKTTLLKWLTKSMSDYDFMFLGKPPLKPEELIDLFNFKYKPFWNKLKSLYQLPAFLEKKKPLVLIIDEAHESKTEVLEWIRVLADQTQSLYIIFSALPVFENQLRSKLETLRKRIACKAELLSISKEDMIEMIKKRIIYAGGNDIQPFSTEALDYIYMQSGGFPREVIRIANSLINKAAELNKEVITPEIFDKKEEQTAINIDEFSDKQKQILELLLQPLSTEGIVNMIGIENFKSKTHGIRSINNILKRLLELGYVERTRKNRNFIYTISPKLQTIFIKT